MIMRCCLIICAAASLKGRKKLKSIFSFALVFLSFLLVFTSCSEAVTDDEVCNSPFFVNHHSDYVESGNIMYFVQQRGHYSDGATYIDAYLISSLDTATGECMPLCGKPECLHNDMECNAYIGTSGIWLMLYNGRLYWLEGNYNNTTLYSMNIDGTGRKKEMPVDPELFKLAYGMGTAEIIDNVLYICGTAESVKNGKIIRSAVVFKQSFDESKGELIYRIDDCVEAFGRIMDGKLYFAISEEYSEDEDKPLSTMLFSYDIKSGELLELYSNAEPNAAYQYIIAADGMVYLFGFDRGLVYSCADGRVSVLNTVGQTSTNVGDGYYMCWEMGGKYTVRDMQGNTLYSGVFPPENAPSFPDALWGRSYIGSSGKKMYYQIDFIRQDGPAIRDIVEFDIETHDVRILFNSQENH